MIHKLRVCSLTMTLVGALGLVFLTTSSALAAAPADTISYWKLDETAPTVPTDPGVYVDSVGDNDGASTGANPTLSPTPAPGQVPIPTVAVPNTAQLFDGTDTGIDVPAVAAFNWGTDDSFSIECWVKIDTGLPDEVHVFVARRDPASDLLWWVGIDNVTGRASFNLVDTGNNEPAAQLLAVGTIDLSDGGWHQVVAVRDGATDENLLYVDGGTLAGGEETSVVFDYPAGFDGAVDGTADITFGYADFGTEFHFAGTLDEVAVYSTALTPAEVQEHYNAGLAGEGIDTLAADPITPTPKKKSGGGGGGGCFINTISE